MPCMGNGWHARTLEALEFQAVRQTWIDHAQTPLGREAIAQREPTKDLTLAELRQEETAQARRLYDIDPPPGISNAKDVRSEVARAAIGGVLSPEELYKTFDTLKASRHLKERLSARRDDFSALWRYGQSLAAISALEKSIETAVSPSGEILDSASDDLARIRREQKRTAAKLTEQLSQLLGSAKWRDLLQEPIHTIRSGRHCVPVRADRRGQAKGIVHDYSASGSTLFIEPEEIVPLGNRLRELEGEEKEEIEAILYSLSRDVEAHAEAIRAGLEALAQLDLLFAAAQYAIDLRAIRPTLNDKGIWRIAQARHPLLDSASVVPVDIEVGRAFQALIITGPNTGGKTVCLKTIGLLTLMALCGLPVPAQEGAQIAVPGGIYADIGDEQSLQQSLSTFSGHIKHIAHYVDVAGANDLILLDEVGAGTDPSEGAALAKAILTRLAQKGARIVATSHYGELKAFAYEREGFQNAAMEFDMETLRPTYRLRLGAPGASHALPIAKRLGLDPNVVDAAMSLLGAQEADLQSMMRKLEEAQLTTERSQEELANERQAVAELRAELERKIEQAEEARLKAREHAQAEIDAIVSQIRREADQALITLRSAPKESKETFEAETKIRNLDARLPQRPKKKTVKSDRPVEKGAKVRADGFPGTGTVIEMTKPGKAKVAFNKMTTELDISDLQVVEPVKATKVQVSASKVLRDRAFNTARELDLHGVRAEEAEPQIDKFIDDCLAAGMSYARINHGKGAGILKKLVRERASHLSFVSKIESASFDDGGDGVSIVHFKKR